MNDGDNNNNHQTADAVASLSAKMASLYYKEVPVCHTCYKIYTIVDDARQRALKKIAMQKEKLIRKRPGSCLTNMSLKMIMMMMMMMTMKMMMMKLKWHFLFVCFFNQNIARMGMYEISITPLISNQTHPPTCLHTYPLTHLLFHPTLSPMLSHVHSRKAPLPISISLTPTHTHLPSSLSPILSQQALLPISIIANQSLWPKLSNKATTPTTTVTVTAAMISIIYLPVQVRSMG